MKFLEPLSRRLGNLVSRVVVRLVDDAAKMQLLQVGALAGETRDGVPRVQSYGMTSVPLAGAEGIALFLDGRRDRGVVIAVDDRRYRLTELEPGEVALYTDEGDKLVLKRGGTIEVTASTAITLNAPAVNLAGTDDTVTDTVAMGAALNGAISSLGTAIAAALTTAGGGVPGGPAPVLGATMTTAGTAVTNAVTVFNGSAADALSTKVKL